MADEREKISTGPNDRPLNETIAGTGPGIPDDALLPGKDLPEPPDPVIDDKVEIERSDGSFLTRMEVVVSPEDDAEVRRIILQNNGKREREIET